MVSHSHVHLLKVMCKRNERSSSHNVYPTTVKVKITVSIDNPAVEEVMNLRDNKGTQKPKLDVGGKGQEEVSDRGSKGVVDVAKGDVMDGR